MLLATVIDGTTTLAAVIDGTTTLAAAAVQQPGLLVVAGFVAGVLGGMVGIGGGILIVPVLIYAQGLGERQAIATSLAAMVPMSIAAAIRHYRYGNLRPKEGFALGALGVAGAAIGASIANIVPESALRTSFAILMLLIAAQLIWKVRQERRAARGAERPLA